MISRIILLSNSPTTHLKKKETETRNTTNIFYGVSVYGVVVCSGVIKHSKRPSSQLEDAPIPWSLQNCI
jgi:hypothetical protein